MQKSIKMRLAKKFPDKYFLYITLFSANAKHNLLPEETP